MASTMPQALRYSNLQLLRFIAAFIVVVFHCLQSYMALGGEGGTVLTRLMWHGKFGVDIFFVISGFVIAATTLHKPRTLESSLDFGRKRFLRIYMGYWPIFLWALAQTYFLSHERLDRINYLGSFTLTELSMFKLVLGVSWTLTYELYFYAMFALLFLVSKSRVILIVYALFAVILFRTLFFELEFGHPLHFFSSGLLLEFLSGVILYVHIHRLKSRLWLLLCLVIFFVPWFFVFQDGPEGEERAFSYGVSALAIVCFMLLLEKHSLFTSSKLGVILGDASYTLYLVHTLLLQIFVVLLVQPYLVQMPGLIKGLALVIALLTIVVFSVVAYFYVERPLYRWAVSRTSALSGVIGRNRVFGSGRG